MTGIEQELSELLLRAVLRSLAGHSEAMGQACVGYVRDGDASALRDLTTLSVPPPSRAPQRRRSEVEEWWQRFDALDEALQQAGVFIREPTRLRHRYYASRPSPEELMRFARLLPVLVGGVERRVPGVPVWLTMLLDDVVGTALNPDSVEEYLKNPPPDASPDTEMLFVSGGDPDYVSDATALASVLPGWDASFVAELLVADGHLRDEAEGLALLAMIQQAGERRYGRVGVSDLPGIIELLAVRGLPAVDADDSEECGFPYYEPVEETKAGPAVIAELKEAVADRAQQARRYRKQAWAKEELAQIDGLTRDDYDDVVRAANGEPVVPRLLKTYGSTWFHYSVRSLSLIHLLRLARHDPDRPELSLITWWREIPPDLRVLEDAIRRAGVHADQIGEGSSPVEWCSGFSFVGRWGQALSASGWSGSSFSVVLGMVVSRQRARMSRPR